MNHSCPFSANNALLDALRNAGTAGLHIDDIMKLLGFDARKQVQPRLYDLQNRGLVERLPAQKWRILEAAEVASEFGSLFSFCYTNSFSFKKICRMFH